MKKILTSFALLCFFTTLYAQDCAFQFQGRELADGSEVTIFAREDPLFGDLVCDTNPSDDAENGLFLINKTSSAISCSATDERFRNPVVYGHGLYGRQQYVPLQELHASGFLQDDYQVRLPTDKGG